LAKAGQLLQANSVLSGNAAQSSKGAAARSPNANQLKPQGTVTKTACPKCGEAMSKIPSKSKN
jgi:predicted RNA-binding Zn-ribbon protein involved in translation (DUF1610 family)